MQVMLQLQFLRSPQAVWCSFMEVNMKSKLPIILIIFSLCAIILGVSITAIISFKHLNADVYMFKSIEECWKIETQAEENSVFNRYLDTSRDNYLSGLSYNSFFSGKYSCEQYEFEIFAYEFNDTMSAIEYFKKITGKDSIQKSTNFSLSSGIAQSRIIAISETNAYIVYCPTKDFTDVCKMLEKIFTVKIS